MSHPWTCLTICVPTGISNIITIRTFSWYNNICRFFCRFFIGVNCWCLSQVISLLTSTTLLKNSLRVLFAGRIRFRISLWWSKDRSYNIMRAWVFVWFSALRYLISSFRGSTWLQSPTDTCFSSRYFFTTIVCSRKKDFNASILEFNHMIWSLKSHTEVLLSIELEMSSCSGAIGSC